MAIKGYVVRGTALGDVQHVEKRDTLGAAVSTWTALVMNEAVRPRIFRVLDDGREERLPSYEEALDRLDRDDEHVKAIDHYREGLYRILRGEVDPIEIAGTYLGEDAPKSDPLAALEAAERRLLEAGGWRPSGDADYPGYWRDRDGRMFKQAVAILAERRRIAAKGGA